MVSEVTPVSSHPTKIETKQGIEVRQLAASPSADQSREESVRPPPYRHFPLNTTGATQNTSPSLQPAPLGSPGEARWRFGEILCAVVCLLTALAVRWRAADHSLSFDELWILAGATGYGENSLGIPPNRLETEAICTTAVEQAKSPWVVWSRGVTFHPPLHMVTLWGWRAFWGGSDWVAAMYSAVCAVVGIGFVFAALRYQAGVGPATCVSLCLALSPVQTQLGTEIRGYGLLLALVGCVLWQMVRIETFGPTRRRVWLLGLTLLPLMLTHYFAAATCLGVCVWGLLRLPMTFRWQLAGAVVVAALTYAVIWLPFTMTHLQHAQTMVLHKARVPFLQGAARSALALPVKLLFVVSPARQREWMVVGAMFGLLLVSGVWRSSRVTPWALLLVLPIGLLLVVDAARGTNQAALVRYAAAASLAAAATPILSAFAIRNWLGWTVGIGCVLLTLVGLGGPRQMGSPSFGHMRQALFPILQAESPQIPLVVQETQEYLGFFDRAMLLEWLHTPGFLPRPVMFVGNPPEDVEQAVAAATPEGQFWLCLRSGPQPRTELPESVRQAFPSARPVRPPIYVPAGQSGIQPEPAVELWLAAVGRERGAGEQ